jgi:hypothetical protein
MTPASTGLTSMTFVAFQDSATMSVAHHTVRLVAATAVALVAFLASGKDGARVEAQLSGTTTSSAPTSGL